MALVSYLDSQNGEHWQDVEVIAAHLGCEDDVALARVLRNLPPEEWTRLEQWLEACDHVSQPGLRHLSLPGSDAAQS